MSKEWIGTQTNGTNSLCIYCWKLDVRTDLYQARHQEIIGKLQSNPGIDHWKVAKKVLRYPQGTKDRMLTYRRSDHLEVIGYSDSDYAGCMDSRKSTFGYLFLLAGWAISWKSAKQTVIAISTMEAEFVACFKATVHCLWMWNFISGLGIVDTIAKPLKI